MFTISSVIRFHSSLLTNSRKEVNTFAYMRQLYSTFAKKGDQLKVRARCLRSHRAPSACHREEVWKGSRMHNDPDKWPGCDADCVIASPGRAPAASRWRPALGIPWSTMVRILGSDNAEPGRQVIERAQAFLAGNGVVTITPSGNSAAPSALGHRLSEPNGIDCSPISR